MQGKQVFARYNRSFFPHALHTLSPKGGMRMRPWQCGGGAIICFCLGVGLLLSLLFSSPFLTGVIGVFLLLCGIVLTQRK